MVASRVKTANTENIAVTLLSIDTTLNILSLMALSAVSKDGFLYAWIASVTLICSEDVNAMRRAAPRHRTRAWFLQQSRFAGAGVVQVRKPSILQSPA
jgi:hypothetical protein